MTVVVLLLQATFVNYPPFGSLLTKRGSSGSEDAANKFDVYSSRFIQNVLLRCLYQYFSGGLPLFLSCDWPQ